MKSRRSFIKTVSTGAIAAGVGIHPVMAGTGIANQPVVDDLTAGLPDITDQDYLDRQERARNWMRKFNMDAVLIEGGVNMSYFTGTGWGLSERLFGLILSIDRDPVWIAPAFELKRAHEVITFGTDIRTWEEHESPYALLSGIMKDLGRSGGNLGIGPNVRNFIVEGIRRDTSLNLTSGALVTENTRAVKTAKELGYMEVANKITKLAYRDGFSQLKEGMSSEDLSNLIRQAHAGYGASGGGFALFEKASAFPHGTRERHPLREGDIILVDGGCSVKGFRSDVTRTIVFGEPSQRQRQVFEAVLEAQQAAFFIIKQGLPCAEADRAARKVIEKAGLGSGYQTFTHRLGHGIGMEGHEYPYLVSSNPMEMQAGMTFTNEPGVYLYGEFGVRIEDSFYVTADGYKILGDLPCIGIDKPFES